MIDKKSRVPVTEDTDIPYEIKIKGHLDEHWTDWLGGLEITQDEQGNSLLTGVVPDQAALHGILTQIRDLGLTLVSITPKDIDNEASESEDENVKQGSE
jgi:hypothetical protein